MAIIIDGSNTPVEGGVAFGNSGELSFTTTGQAGQVLVSNGSTPPTWQTLVIQDNALMMYFFN